MHRRRGGGTRIRGGGGGGSGVVQPLSNVLFADVGKASNGNGSIATPFNNLAALVTALQSLVVPGATGLLTPGTYNEIPLNVGAGLARLTSLSGYRDVIANFETAAGGSLVLQGFQTAFLGNFAAAELTDCQVTVGEGTAITCRRSDVVTSINANTFMAFETTFQNGATISAPNLIFDFSSFKSAVAANVDLTGAAFSVVDSSLECVSWGGLEVGNTISYAQPWRLDFTSGTNNFDNSIFLPRPAIITRLSLHFESPLSGDPDQIVDATLYVDGGATSVVAQVDGPDQFAGVDALQPVAANERLAVGVIANVAVVSVPFWVSAEYMQLATTSFQL